MVNTSLLPLAFLYQRSRDDYEAPHDDDDDISIASRTPSPPPEDAMDVDMAPSYKYDEYVRGPAREVITVETKIKSTNNGFAMRASMGWTEGQPLGLAGEGTVALWPAPFVDLTRSSTDRAHGTHSVSSEERLNGAW